MHINSSDQIAGVPILEVRKLLLRGRDGYWGLEFVQHNLKLDQDQAETLLQELEQQRYIELSHERHDQPRWVNTIKGNALSNASGAKPVSRKTADRAYGEFLDRVKEINHNPYYLYRVSKVTLFGSYLGDSPTVNDIDVIIELQPKETDQKKHARLMEQRRKEVLAQEVHIRNFLELVTYAETEVWKYLKSHSRVISLHTSDQDVTQLGKHKVVDIG